MAKLYATLETSKGKVVSVSDNSQIVATLYDGNLKAYSITIEWCAVGDYQGKILMDALVTTREWRNQPDEKRKGNIKCCNCGKHFFGLEGKEDTCPKCLKNIIEK